MPADPQVTRGKGAFALIVGIGRYRDPGIRPLDFTHADARSFRDLLVDPERTGFAPDNVRLLLDEEATRVNIRKAINRWLVVEAKEESTVIVFFAGHGGQEPDATNAERDGISKYLLPWDADPQCLLESALSSEEFQRDLSVIRAKRLVVFLDSCYAGGVVAKGTRDIAVAGLPFERFAQGEGRIVIAAAQGNQTSLEDRALGHGVFTHHLLEALSGKADADGDGIVSITEVFKYLQKVVPDTARRISPTSVQVPLLCGQLSTDIVLTADLKRVSQKQAQRHEEEQRRLEELRKRRKRLADLFEDGSLHHDVYVEALGIAEAPESALHGVRAKLRKHLERLLADKISAADYAEIRESLQARPPDPPTPPPRPPEPPPVKRDARRFCTRCGAAIVAGTAFCRGCGLRL